MGTMKRYGLNSRDKQTVNCMQQRKMKDIFMKNAIIHTFPLARREERSRVETKRRNKVC